MSDDQGKSGPGGNHLSWKLLLRLPPEWRGPLEEMATRTTRPMGRRLNVSDAIRMLIYRGLVADGLIKGESDDER